MFTKTKKFFKSQAAKIKDAFAVKKAAIVAGAHEVLDGTVAEAYVDTGVKILIAVVVGALLLAGLYALFGDTIMPTVTEKVEELLITQAKIKKSENGGIYYVHKNKEIF